MTSIDLACRVILGGVFLVAATAKLRTRAAMAETVGLTQQLGFGRAARPAAGLLVATELGIVALLVNPGTVRFGYPLAAAVLAAFSIGITRLLRQRRSVPCRCFGADGATLGGQHLLRNGLLFGIAAIGGVGRWTVGPWTPADPPGVGGVVLTLAVAAVVVALFVRWDDLTFVLWDDPARRHRGRGLT